MRLQYFRYKLPFKQPFGNAQSTFSHRHGLFIHLKKAGVNAWGEAAPLPGFSKETLPEVIDNLRHYNKAINYFFRSSFTAFHLSLFLKQHAFPPSLQFGLYSTGCSFLAQQKGKSLHHFLFDDPSDTVLLNAVVGLAQQERLNIINRQISCGFTTIKIKVDDRDPSSLIELLQTVRQRYPQIKIRLDANQSWSMPQAVQFLKDLAPFQIEYCEEPLVNPTEEAIAKLAAKSPIPLALDESLIQNIPLHQAVDLVPVIIIKPMVLGIQPVQNLLKKKNKTSNAKLIFTSSIESSIGRLMTAALATGWGAPKAAHGLATGSLLAQDVWQDDLFLKDGSFTLPNATLLEQLMDRNSQHLDIEEITI